MTLDPINGAIVSASSTAWSTTSSRPTVPRPKSTWGARAASTSWPGPRASAGPTPWWKWRPAAGPPPPRASAPPRSFHVLVGYETLHGRICELENGTVLPPSALEPWMDSAYFERALFTLGNRVDVSVRSCLFTGGTRRAIERRDRLCTHPALLRARRELPGRPHRDLRRRRADHPGQLLLALRLPQPTAQPKRGPARAPLAIRAAPAPHLRARPRGRPRLRPSPPRRSTPVC